MLRLLNCMCLIFVVTNPLSSKAYQWLHQKHLLNKQWWAMCFTPRPSVVLVWINPLLNNYFMAICTPSRSHHAIWLVNKKLECFHSVRHGQTQSMSVFKISLFSFTCLLCSSISLRTCSFSCRSTLVSPKVLRAPLLVSVRQCFGVFLLP